jgi:hypothetical protein
MMGISKVTEDWKAGSVELSLNRDTQRIEGSGVRAFDVDFTENDPDFKPLVAAMYATGVPVPWECLPGYPWSYVVGYSAKASESGPLSVKVLVNYKIYEDPLAVPPVIRWSFASESDVLESGCRPGSPSTIMPVLNSAGEPPDPPMMKEYRDLLLQVTVNRSGFDPLIAAKYIDAVNSDTFFGFAAGKVKCRRFDADQLRAAGLVYYQLNFEFQIRTFASDAMDVGWTRRFLDAGFRERVYEKYAESSGKNEAGIPMVTSYYHWKMYDIGSWLPPEYNDDGTEKTGAIFKPVSKQVPLNGAGRVLADGDEKHFIEIQDFDQLPFSVLGLE